MPVIRSRGGARFEAGRGYPRLKWSDINKATIIANELQFEEEKALEGKRTAKYNHVEGAVDEKRKLRRRGVLIHSDGESEDEESLSDNSLIYSDFQLSPESGKVRMAFTVPLPRLTTSQKEQHHQQQSVFHSTLQIRHTMVDRFKKGTTVVGAPGTDGKGPPPSCCVGHKGPLPAPQAPRIHVCSKNLKKSGKVGVVDNVPAIPKLQKKPKENGRQCTKIPATSPQLQRDCTRVDLDTARVSVTSPSDSSSLYPRGDVGRPRPASFWREIRAGGKGCIASQKYRLRDATFIIYPSDSEGSSRVRERRNTPKKGTGKPIASPQREVPALNPDKTMNRATPTITTKASPLLPLCQWVTPLNDPCRRTQRLPATASPLEVGTCLNPRRVPVTFTSASHTSLRCYPPLGCHPSSQCQPLSFPSHHCFYCHSNSPKCRKNDTAKPEGRSNLLEGRKVLPEGEKALPEGRNAILNGRNNLLEGRKVLPEGKNSLPEGRKTLPDGKNAIFDGKKAVPEGCMGLTIRNRHANMDSEDELRRRGPPISRKPLDGGNTPSSIVTSVGESMGQRNSSGGGCAPPKRTSNPPTPASSTPPTNGTPRHSPRTPLSANPASAPKGKRVLKTTVRETGTKKSFQTRPKPASSSSATSSPATLHGRVLQKTASVSPAPSKPHTNTQSASLTRFGFKSTPLITSGESTDSVNSILSDAQTTSDATSTVFDFPEENGNDCEPTLTDFPLAGPDLEPISPSLNPKEGNEGTTVRGLSPCTISEASSGVTSSLNRKLKAQTRQLPTPQTVTVKGMSKQASPAAAPRSRFGSSVSRKEASPQRSPMVTPKQEQRSRIPQNCPTKSSPPKVQRMSRDSESSNKSFNTVDSGLGSSSESDKLRSQDAVAGSPDAVAVAGSEKTDKSVSDKGAKKDGKLELDVSDAWLKEKRETRGVKGKSCELNLKFVQESVYPAPGKPSLHDKPAQKESFKEKRDSSITYGMARQKFAPYSRNRLGYQNVLTKTNSPSTGVNQQKKDDVSPHKTKLGTDVGNGMVRRRIAQLETPAVTSKPATCQQLPKKPAARPTAIEKTPILVSPKTENTVELSRTICRRLEYSEGRSSLLEALKDNKLENHLIELPTTAQDLLMVDSFELKKDKQNNDQTPSPVEGQDISVRLPKKEVLDENSEPKRIQDISECENVTKRLSEDSNGNHPSTTPGGDKEDEHQEPTQTSLLHQVPYPEGLPTKLISPDGSDRSFEVLTLESGSVEPSPNEETETAIGKDCFLSKVVVGLPGTPAPVPVTSLGSKHPQGSPVRGDAPLKKCRQDNESERTPVTHTGRRSSGGKQDVWDPCESPSSPKKGPPLRGYQDHPTPRSRGVMESSMESGRSGDSNRTSEAGDRLTVSGKCTPTLSSTRGDVDQDFLIDDEISDQPGLTFGDELDASLFGDEDLFSDVSSTSVSNLPSKSERSRHGSLGTTSSLGPDDLMLDYDLDDTKQATTTTAPPVRNPTNEESTKKTSREKTEKPPLNCDISIPGPRYDEEVLSPVACDILTEWSAILSDARSPSPLTASAQCVSQQHMAVGSVATGSTPFCAGLGPSQANDINTHQPQSLAKENVDEFTLTGKGFPTRSRAASTGHDFYCADAKKGVNFKPPRQGASCEHEGGINMDRTTLHYICQDVTTMKTLLLRLRRVLQVADTINPFDANLKTSLYLSLAANDPSCEREETHPTQDVVQQNVDLKRQMILLQQRLEEKDRTIRVLQQQLTTAMLQVSSSSSVTSSSSGPPPNLTPPSSPVADGGDVTPPPKRGVNAATQTERLGHRSSPFNLAAISRNGADDGLGPTVSSETANGTENDHGSCSQDSLAEVKILSPPQKLLSSDLLVTVASKSSPMASSSVS